MAQSKKNKLGKALLAFAIAGYYAFASDEVENVLDKALIKYENKSDDWRKQVRLYLWSFSKIRDQICKEAMEIWG